MKASIKISMAVVLLFSMACGAKKSTQSKMEKNQQEMSAQGTDESQDDTTRDDSASESESMDKSNNSVQTNNGSTGGNANVNTDATAAPVNEKMNYLEMYSELEMSDAQIQRFESALRDFNTQQRNTPNGEMMGTLSDEKDRQLKEILSADQYTAYENWKTD